MDRALVIVGLAALKEDYLMGKCGVNSIVIDEAIRLLKEQEPAQIEIEGGGATWWHVCGECHGSVDDSDLFCKHCGRPLINKTGREGNHEKGFACAGFGCGAADPYRMQRF